MRNRVVPGEMRRLEALQRLGIDDPTRDEDFDFHTSLAAQLVGARYSCLNFVGENAVWCRSAYGFDLDGLPRQSSLCSHVIESCAVVSVYDASKDPRFMACPLVTSAPFVRTYVGVPVFVEEEHAVASLCVMDPDLIMISAEKVRLLVELAERLSSELDRRLRKQGAFQGVETTTLMTELMNRSMNPQLLVDADCAVLECNQAALDVFGWGQAPRMQDFVKLLGLETTPSMEALAMRGETGRVIGRLAGDVKTQMRIHCSDVGSSSSRAWLVEITDLNQLHSSASGVYAVDFEYTVSLDASRQGNLHYISRPDLVRGDGELSERKCFEVLFDRQSLCEDCPVFVKRNAETIVRGSPASVQVLACQRADARVANVRVQNISAETYESLQRYTAQLVVDRAGLTDREAEVYHLMVQGETVTQIAKSLGVTPRTIKFHQSNVIRKCGASSRLNLWAKIARLSHPFSNHTSLSGNP